MLRVVTLTFFVAMGIVLGGCTSTTTTKTAATPGNDVLNVAAAPAPAPMPTAEPVAAAPINVSPISDAPIAMNAPAAPAVQTSLVSGSASGSKSYTVKKGDTLFSIAKNQMGSGRDWQKLVSANPGLDPHKLKVGQTITIPS